MELLGPMLPPGMGASSSRDCFVQRLTNTNYWLCYWFDEAAYRFLTVPPPVEPEEPPLPPGVLEIAITGDVTGRAAGGRAASEVLLIRDLAGTGVDTTGTATGLEFEGDAVGQGP